MSRTFIGLVLAISASSVGCSVLNREEYSLILRKPAHAYQPLDPEPAAAPAANLSGLNIPDILRLPVMEPFKPFAYCHLHKSAHPMESVVAIAVSPAELPTCIAIKESCEAARSLGRLWRHLMGPEPPTVPPPVERDPPRR